MYPVEKNIPVPKKGPPKTWKYPWRELEVTDSFFVPDKTKHAMDILIHMRTKKIKNNDPNTYLAKEENGGVRVWRTS